MLHAGKMPACLFLTTRHFAYPFPLKKIILSVH